MKQKISLWLNIALLCVVTLGLVAPVEAHHSFAMFDKNKPVIIKGVVSKLEWKNPHVFIFVDVAGGQGGIQTYAVECGSISLLTRAGWKFNSVKAGDAVSVTLYPLIDGQPGGLLESVALPNGDVLKG